MIIHAQPRIAPSPIDNKRVDRNPPPLLWPAEKGEDVRYAVRFVSIFRFSGMQYYRRRGVSLGDVSIHIENSQPGYGIGNTVRQ